MLTDLLRYGTAFLLGIGFSAAAANTLPRFLGRRRQGQVSMKSVEEAISASHAALIKDLISPFLDEAFKQLEGSILEHVAEAYASREDVHQAFQRVATHEEVETAVRAVVQRLSPNGQVQAPQPQAVPANANMAAMEEQLRFLSEQLGLPRSGG